MWLSKGFANKGNDFKSNIENAVLTISSDEEMEANGSTNARNIRVYSPYGYSYVAPSGQETLLLDASFGKAVAGIRMNARSLKNGEILISNDSGAYILLKNDGSVEINGHKFEKGGAINENK